MPRQRLGALVVLTISLAFCALGAEANDWLIVPGQRVGPITENTTRAGLALLFGAKNVEDGDITTADEVNPGTLVWKNEPEMSLGITWNDDTPEPHIGSIQFCAGAMKCRWHTADGISLGSSLKALEGINKRPFQLLGFAWDWEGTVVSWNDGKLEKLMRSCAGLGLRLVPKADQNVPDSYIGDREISSSEPEMQKLNPVVTYMTFGFQPIEGCRK